MKMIDKKQIQIIHVAKAQLGLTEDAYRLCILAQTKGKKQSSKDLTYFEADGLINYFIKDLGFNLQSNYIRTSGAARRARWQGANERRRAKKYPANVVMLANVVQLDLIEKLRDKVSWQYQDGFERWLKRFMRISAVRTASEASKTIEGLKGLIRNQAN